MLFCFSYCSISYIKINKFIVHNDTITDGDNEVINSLLNNRKGVWLAMGDRSQHIHCDH